ncbi:MAG: hypothetical protein EHM23_13020 [Acidobacteria bacterium]|nr:MAG: hypothetical protein EHM23_13020 [Acidobacteriota bacterium]
MGKEYPKWLVGCGVGCLAVLVVAFILGIGGFLAMRKVAGGFQEAQKAVSRVESEFGSPEGYSPEPDGRIPADRMEAFLAVRDATSSVRANLGTRVEELEAMSGDGAPRNKSGLQKFLTIMRSGVGTIPRIAEFERNRADALTANRMGLGEYWYIYTLAYYSSAKKDPGDGPKRVHSGDNENIRIDGHTDPQEIREARRSAMSRRVDRLFRRILENAVKDSKSAEKSPWIQAVEKELTALEEDRDRIPWADGLPPPIDESLRPFREKLDQSYDPVMNPLEFIEFGHHGDQW